MTEFSTAIGKQAALCLLVDASLHSTLGMITITVFLLLFFSLHACFSAVTTQEQLLFEGSIHFIWKPADSNDGCTGAIQLGLIAPVVICAASQSSS